MRLRHLSLIALASALAGCAAYTERSSLGYGDYVGYSCDQLGQEAVRLMRTVANRSEHVFEDDGARRETAKQQLQAVKRASVEKQCERENGKL